MLPVDAEGKPLMNGVLYGVDGRAEAEVRYLTDIIGKDAIISQCGNALTSQSVGPKILWAETKTAQKLCPNCLYFNFNQLFGAAFDRTDSNRSLYSG